MLRETIDRLTTLGVDILKRRTEKLALRATGDAELAREFVQEVSLTDAEREAILTLGAEVAAKYQASLRYAPEIGLVIAVGGYVWRANGVNEQLAKLALQAKATATTPPPEPKP